MLWIIDNQKGRRNIAEIDLIDLQRKREVIIARIAKANQKNSYGQGTKGLAKLPNLKPMDTRKECAKAAGVGERTYDAGKLVLKAAAEGKIKPAGRRNHGPAINGKKRLREIMPETMFPQRHLRRWLTN